MDLESIETALSEIKVLLSKVEKALQAPTNESEPVTETPKNSGLISVPLFEGFTFNEAAHACYAFLCLNAKSGRSQAALIKEYLRESGRPLIHGEVECLRMNVTYLCKTKRLPKPWLAKKK